MYIILVIIIGPVTTDNAAKKLLTQYLKQQNRPYSSIQVYDNLHHRISKSTVDRLLDFMSSNDLGVKCKEYGKAKIYFVDQSIMKSDYQGMVCMSCQAYIFIYPINSMYNS